MSEGACCDSPDPACSDYVDHWKTICPEAASPGDGAGGNSCTHSWPPCPCWAAQRLILTGCSDHCHFGHPSYQLTLASPDCTEALGPSGGPQVAVVPQPRGLTQGGGKEDPAEVGTYSDDQDPLEALWIRYTVLDASHVVEFVHSVQLHHPQRRSHSFPPRLSSSAGTPALAAADAAGPDPEDSGMTGTAAWQSPAHVPCSRELAASPLCSMQDGLNAGVKKNVPGKRYVERKTWGESPFYGGGLPGHSSRSDSWDQLGGPCHDAADADLIPVAHNPHLLAD